VENVVSQVLTTNVFYGTPPATPVNPPAPSITMPEPISYEFQVVEFVDKNKITKVALQVKRNTHDQYGNIKIHGTWQDVPRVKVEEL
jgi:hypothetical protein